MIKEHLTLFEQYLKYEKRMSAHTLLAYDHDLNQFAAYLAGTYELEDTARVEALHIRSYLVHLYELKLKERTLQRKISSVKSFFKFLLKREMISINPVLQIRAPKAPARLPVFLEQHQSSKLFEDISYPEGWDGLNHQLILELLYQTGIRRGELIGLKEQEVDLYRNELVVLGKRNKERAIPIGADLVQLIREYLKEKKRIINSEHNNLLTLESGKPLYDKYVYRVVNHYLSQDKITTLSKKSPHVIRHTFATHLTHNGANISAIKELLGHSSLAATQIYTHSNIEHLKKIYQQAHPKATNES